MPGCRWMKSTPTFTINNPNPGATHYYSIRLFADEGGFDVRWMEHRSAGRSQCVDVLDDTGHVYFTIHRRRYQRCEPGGLLEQRCKNSGAKAALDQLVGDGLLLCGSEDGDHAETYGTDGQYHLAGGNDFLNISYSFTTAYGDAGNDTFTILKGGLFGLSLHGGSAVALTGSETNTVNFKAAGTLAFDDIDGITNFKFSGNGSQFIFLGADQLPPPSVFHVTGSASRPNGIAIDRGDTVGALHLNLSQVTLTNFGRLNQSFTFDLTGDVTPRADSVVGVLNARDVFEFAGGNDTAIGGNKADVFFGGRGNDFFNGRGGMDVANFSGASSKYVIKEIAAHRYSVHDIRLHSPDGTDVVFNVEYLQFSNKYVFIGDLHA